MENQFPQVPNPIPQAQNVLKTFTKPAANKSVAMLVGVGVLVAVLGVGGGWLMAGRPSVLGSRSANVPGAVNTAKEAGLADESTFKDSAEGVLKEGGIKGEGTHHLERSGGESQNVYLTSSVIDLESFKDKKVQVWGQTISGKEAGWLMDVGKVKVIE